MSEPTHILVVEDEPLSREMIVRRLISRNFSAVGVENAPKAIDYIAANHVDLVLMDNELPLMTGIEAVKLLRKSWSHDALPIIMVSAMIDSDDVVEGLHAGANDYVVKPINFNVLLARIETAITIKHNVTLLLAAENQRVVLQSLHKSAAEISQPFVQMIDELEEALENNAEPRDITDDRLHRLLELAEKAVEQIEKMSAIPEVNKPFIKRSINLDPT